MTHKFHLLQGIAVPVFAAATFTAVAASAGATVNVADVEQLYAAVNDPADVGATVVLAPGIYSLSVNNPAGAPRPNGGRLELQQDMSPYGVAGDRAAVVIDAAALPQSPVRREISPCRDHVNEFQGTTPLATGIVERRFV